MSELCEVEGMGKGEEGGGWEEGVWVLKRAGRDGILDGATEAAVAQLEPFFNLLTFLTDGQGFLDVGS